MRQITNYDCMSQAVITATTTEFPSEWSKEEREKAEQGMIAMYGPSDPLWYGMIEAGYSSKYTNDAAYGGEKGGYSRYVWDAIDPAFKEYFMKRI